MEYDNNKITLGQVVKLQQEEDIGAASLLADKGNLAKDSDKKGRNIKQTITISVHLTVTETDQYFINTRG